MVDRINLILKAKNLTSRQFAEEIGIQPSGMSHIMSGRNRPSLDFVMKVISRYPEIDIKWLTLGQGEMYNTTSPNTKTMSKSQPDLFSSLQEETVSEVKEDKDEYTETVESIPEAAESDGEEGQSSIVVPGVRAASIADDQSEMSIPQPPLNTQVLQQSQTPAPALAPTPAPIQAPSSAPSTPLPSHDEAQKTKQGKRIVKVVILYDDHSFAEYYPE